MYYFISYNYIQSNFKISPVQFFPFGDKKCPLVVQEHSNEPYVFLHDSSQPPLFVSHSLTSILRNCYELKFNVAA